MESPVPNNPREKHAADSIPDFVGPERSKKLPKNAADITKKKDEIIDDTSEYMQKKKKKAKKKKKKEKKK